MTANNQLIIDNISYKLGNKFLLKNISLEVSKGEIICLVGPSGCGKTTLLKTIAGLIKASSGEISLNGRGLTNIPANKRHVGFVLQNPSLLPHMNIEDNITLGVDSPYKRRKARELLKNINMDKYAKSYPWQLSVGQQQKISILRALAIKPDIMLFDEPYANLDIMNKEKLIEQSLNLMKETNAIKIMVTHNPYEAMMVADKIYVMKEGKIAQSGSAKELYDDPHSEFIARLFGQVNVIQSRYEEKYAHNIFGKFALSSNHNEKFLVRPEDIMISKVKKAGYILGEVINILFTGNNLLFCKIGDQQIKVASSKDFQKGDKLYLKVKKYQII